MELVPSKTWVNKKGKGEQAKAGERGCKQAGREKQGSISRVASQWGREGETVQDMGEQKRKGEQAKSGERG